MHFKFVKSKFRWLFKDLITNLAFESVGPKKPELMLTRTKFKA
jgi:hypothetical protein